MPKLPPELFDELIKGGVSQQVIEEEFPDPLLPPKAPWTGEDFTYPLSPAEIRRNAETPMEEDQALGPGFGTGLSLVEDKPIAPPPRPLLDEASLFDVATDPTKPGDVQFREQFNVAAQSVLDLKAREGISRVGYPTVGLGVKNPLTGEVTTLRVPATAFGRTADPVTKKKLVELIQSGLSKGEPEPTPGGLKDLTELAAKWSQDRTAAISDIERSMVRTTGTELHTGQVDEISRLLADEFLETRRTTSRPGVGEGSRVGLGPSPGILTAQREASLAIDDYLKGKDKTFQKTVRYNQALGRILADEGAAIDPSGNILFSTGEVYKIPKPVTPGGVALRGKALQDRIDELTGKKKPKPAPLPAKKISAKVIKENFQAFNAAMTNWNNLSPAQRIALSQVMRTSNPELADIMFHEAMESSSSPKSMERKLWSVMDHDAQVTHLLSKFGGSTPLTATDAGKQARKLVTSHRELVNKRSQFLLFDAGGDPIRKAQVQSLVDELGKSELEDWAESVNSTVDSLMRPGILAGHMLRNDAKARQAEVKRMLPRGIGPPSKKPSPKPAAKITKPNAQKVLDLLNLHSQPASEGSDIFNRIKNLPENVTLDDNAKWAKVLEELSRKFS